MKGSGVLVEGLFFFLGQWRVFKRTRQECFVHLSLDIIQQRIHSLKRMSAIEYLNSPSRKHPNGLPQDRRPCMNQHQDPANFDIIARRNFKEDNSVLLSENTQDAKRNHSTSSRCHGGKCP
jgi:hypothetical protein